MHHDAYRSPVTSPACLWCEPWLSSYCQCLLILTLKYCSCCSVAKLCPIVCGPMDCGTPSFSVLHYLLEFAQTHVHGVSDAIQPSHPLSSSCPQSFPASGPFPMSQFFSSGGQSIGASVLASVPSTNGASLVAQLVKNLPAMQET